MGVLWAANSTINHKAFLMKAKDLADDTVKLTSENLQNPSIAIYQRYRIGMIILAAILLIIAGLSTGLILAICGIDQVWLHMKSITAMPNEKEHIYAVTRLKSHGTWMLCSLIICAVACSEYFPFVIQSLFQGPSWIAILISTIFITIFVELIPQFLIPARPLVWGYYCRHVIWACMWLTVVISWPISLLLSHINVKKIDRSIFNNRELRAFIKYHESSGRKGGRLGREASRIMIGALNLDHCLIEDLYTHRLDGSLQTEKILQTAKSSRLNKVLTSWSLAKVINIDDEVNEEFIKKINRWSYTRLPVIGRPEMQQDSHCDDYEEQSESIQVYGYLNLKRLVGYSFSRNNSLLVKDFSLEPLPIVQENMSVYGLLNMFENGISKMALVVPVRKKSVITLVKRIPQKISVYSHTKPMQRLYTQALHFETRKNSQNSISNSTSVDDLVAAALRNANYCEISQKNIVGTKIKKPLGLLTLDDLIGLIFQRSTHIERLSHDRCSHNSPSINKEVRQQVQNRRDIGEKNEFTVTDETNNESFGRHSINYLPHENVRKMSAENSEIHETDVKLEGKQFLDTRSGFITKSMILPSILRFSTINHNYVASAPINTFPCRIKSCKAGKRSSRYVSIGPILPKSLELSRNMPSSRDNLECGMRKDCDGRKQLSGISSSSSYPITTCFGAGSSINPLNHTSTRKSSNYTENINDKVSASFTGENRPDKAFDLSSHEIFTTYLKKVTTHGKINVLPSDSKMKRIYERVYDNNHVFPVEVNDKENKTSRFVSHTVPRINKINSNLTLIQNGISIEDRESPSNYMRRALVHIDLQ